MFYCLAYYWFYHQIRCNEIHKLNIDLEHVKNGIVKYLTELELSKLITAAQTSGTLYLSSLIIKIHFHTSINFI